ncbi:MAG: ankyrin repeat domain-containing protein, partial [Candidatus Binatia bacterium]
MSRQRPLALLVALSALSLGFAACSREPIDEHGMTALMRAAAAGDLDGVRAAIREGADVGREVPGHGIRGLIAFLSWMQQLPTRDEGWTALTYASAGGHADVVRALLAAGADVNRGGGLGETALLVAAGRGDDEVTRLLIEAGAD